MRALTQTFFCLNFEIALYMHREVNDRKHWFRFSDSLEPTKKIKSWCAYLAHVICPSGVFQEIELFLILFFVSRERCRCNVEWRPSTYTIHFTCTHNYFMNIKIVSLLFIFLCPLLDFPCLFLALMKIFTELGWTKKPSEYGEALSHE